MKINYINILGLIAIVLISMGIGSIITTKITANDNIFTTMILKVT